MKSDKFESNSTIARKLLQLKLLKKLNKCPFCSFHSDENRKRRPKEDKYKNQIINLASE